MSAALLVLVLMQVDFSLLIERTAHTDLSLMFFAMLAVLGQIMFLSFRWHELLNAGRKKIDFRTSLLINLSGYFANIILITSIGGIVAKSGLAIKNGVSVVHAILATFLDRFMTLAALVIFTAISLPLLAHILDKQILQMLTLSVVFVILSAALLFTALRSGWLKDFILSNRKRSRLIATLRIVLENPKLMLRTTIQSLIAQAFFILAVYILSIGMEYQGDILEFLALLPVLALISSLPISFGGWGVREGAFIYGLGLIGFSMESAFLLSVQVGVVTMIAPLVLGAPFVLRGNFNVPLYTKD